MVPAVLAKTHNRLNALRRGTLDLGIVVDVVGNKTSYPKGQVSVKSKLGHYRQFHWPI
jgi:hypothetical protein